MADSANAFPYATFLNILFPALERFDVSELAGKVTDQWYNQTLCRVNDSVLRLGVMQGEYHWHKHDNDDEVFFVLSGTFLVDLPDRTVELGPWQGFVVPKQTVHRTRAPERDHSDDRNGGHNAHWRLGSVAKTTVSSRKTESGKTESWKTSGARRVRFCPDDR